MSASIFEEERQVSRLSRPIMPCLAAGKVDSNSSAGPSKSIVNGR